MGYTQELTFWDWICCECDKRNIRSGDDVDYCARCWHQRDCCCTGKTTELDPATENETGEQESMERRNVESSQCRIDC